MSSTWADRGSVRGRRCHHSAVGGGRTGGVLLTAPPLGKPGTGGTGSPAAGGLDHARARLRHSPDAGAGRSPPSWALQHPAGTGTHRGHQACRRIGLGIGCVSKLALRDAFRRGSLVQIPTPDLDLSRQFAFIWHRHKYLATGMREFLKQCRHMTEGIRSSDQIDLPYYS